MKGIIIYNELDYYKNLDYAKWIMKTGRALGMSLDIMLSHKIFSLGIAKSSFDFVINRSRNYEISCLLEVNGIRVFNNSEITLLGNNKLAAYNFARKKQIEFSPVLLDWSSECKVISKPIYGHGGEGIELVNAQNTNFDNTRFQQKFVEDIIGDIRFYIINNNIIHAIIRKPINSFLSNYSKGGKIEKYHYDKSEEKVIMDFITNLKIDYAGIDFFLLKDGRLLFNELEDVAGSRMLSNLEINNTTDLFLNHIKKTIGN